MKIAKAIEILTSEDKRIFSRDFLELHQAAKLGIEALKREEAHRRVSKCGLKYLLPGETKES